MERGLLFHFTEYDGLGQVSWAIVGTLTAAPATATWGSSDISHLLGSATCLNAGPRLEIQEYLRRTKAPFSLSAQMAFGNAGPPNFAGLSSDVAYPSGSAISSDSGRALPGIAGLKPPKGFYGVKDSEGFSKPSRTLYARPRPGHPSTRKGRRRPPFLFVRLHSFEFHL